MNHHRRADPSRGRECPFFKTPAVPRALTPEDLHTPAEALIAALTLCKRAITAVLGASGGAAMAMALMMKSLFIVLSFVHCGDPAQACHLAHAKQRSRRKLTKCTDARHVRGSTLDGEMRRHTRRLGPKIGRPLA